jgi:hypothetical protein
MTLRFCCLPSLLLALLAIGGPAQGQQAATFGPVTAFSTGAGSYPYNMAVADVNSDGQLDIVTVDNGNSSSVKVLLGTGTGSFGAVTAFGTGGSNSFPNAVAVADVNADGKLDLLTANYGNATVGVLLGTGTGSFGAVTTFSTGAGINPRDIAVADVNGDDRLDLLTVNYNNNSTVGKLVVLLGTGTGTFGAATTYSTVGTTNSFPEAIAVADVNGDGKLDALIANRGDTGTVGVLLGTGTGSFGAVTTFSAGVGPGPYVLTPFDIAVADVNGDGKLDLLTANSPGTAGVLLGTGTGSFGAATTFDTGANSSHQSIAVADVNGDGKLDLLTANYGASTVGVLLGTGTGSFGAVTAFGTGGGTRPSSIAVADVNGDGKPDLLTTNFYSEAVAVLLNTTPKVVMSTTMPGSTPSPGLALYPNPVTHGATTLAGGTRGQVVHVFDALGRVITTTSINATGTTTLGGLVPGLYLVRVGTGSVKMVVK